MSNVVKFTMNNVPAGLDSMYVRVEEDVLTQGVRNVLYSGVTPVSGNAIEVNIGENGVVGNGAIISADNYTSGGSGFKYMYGRSLIEAGANNYLLQGERLKFLPVGDSITAGGGGTSTGGDGVTEAIYSSAGYWVNALNSSTQEWELLDEEGVSGDRTADVLARMSPILSSGADVALLLIGTNDVNAEIPNQTIADNVENIVDQMIGVGMKVMLCQVAHRATSQGFNPAIDELNTLYEGIANNRQNDVVLVPEFLDFNSRISDPLKELEVSADGLHPRSFGAWIMGKVVTQVMDNKFLSTSPNYTNLIQNPDLTIVGTDNLSSGATGECPDKWTLFYANPTVGQGGTINIDGSFTVKSGSVSGATGNENRTLLRSFSITTDPSKKYKLGIDLSVSNVAATTTLEVYVLGDSFETSMFKIKYPIGGNETETIEYNGGTIWTDDISFISGKARVIVNITGDGEEPVEWTVSNPRFVQVN